MNMSHQELIKLALNSFSDAELNRPCINISTGEGPHILSEHIEKLSAKWVFHSGYREAVETPITNLSDLKLYIQNYIVGSKS